MPARSARRRNSPGGILSPPCAALSWHPLLARECQFAYVNVLEPRPCIGTRPSNRIANGGVFGNTG